MQSNALPVPIPQPWSGQLVESIGQRRRCGLPIWAGNDGQRRVAAHAIALVGPRWREVLPWGARCRPKCAPVTVGALNCPHCIVTLPSFVGNGVDGPCFRSHLGRSIATAPTKFPSTSRATGCDHSEIRGVLHKLWRTSLPKAARSLALGTHCSHQGKCTLEEEGGRGGSCAWPAQIQALPRINWASRLPASERRRVRRQEKRNNHSIL